MDFQYIQLFVFKDSNILIIVIIELNTFIIKEQFIIEHFEMELFIEMVEEFHWQKFKLDSRNQLMDRNKLG